MKSITRFSGTIYPDKSFSIGVVPAKKKKRVDAEYDRAQALQTFVGYHDRKGWAVGLNKIQGSFCSIWENKKSSKVVLRVDPRRRRDIEVLKEMDNVSGGDYSAFYDVEPPSGAPLLVKSLESSRKKELNYGSRGITTFGRRVVKNSCILLQEKWGKKRLGFGTCTIPTVDRNLCEFLLAEWGDCVRRFYQKLRRLLEKRNINFVYIGVTEIQEGRFSATGLAVPHLHFVYPSKKYVRGGYIFSTGDAYQAWNDAVNEVLRKHKKAPIMGVGKHKGSVRLEPIKKNAAAYLGKYISKGTSVLEKMTEAGYSKFPRQWWTASVDVKKMFKDSLIHMGQEFAGLLFYNSLELYKAEFIAWMRWVFVEYGDRKYRCGLSGALSYDAYDRMCKGELWA